MVRSTELRAQNLGCYVFLLSSRPDGNAGWSATKIRTPGDTLPSGSGPIAISPPCPHRMAFTGDGADITASAPSTGQVSRALTLLVNLLLPARFPPPDPAAYRSQSRRDHAAAMRGHDMDALAGAESARTWSLSAPDLRSRRTFAVRGLIKTAGYGGKARRMTRMSGLEMDVVVCVLLMNCEKRTNDTSRGSNRSSRAMHRMIIARRASLEAIQIAQPRVVSGAFRSLLNPSGRVRRRFEDL